MPSKDPAAHVAFIIMEPEDTPPTSGSNAICAATVLLDGGILSTREPVTELTLEAPGGLVRVRALCRGGKAERTAVENLPSFAERLGVPLEVDGLGTLTVVDTAYRGDSFVVIDPAALGPSLVPDEAHEVARLGVRITGTANEALGFRHPEQDWRHVSFCLFAGAIERGPDGLRARSALREEGMAQVGSSAPAELGQERAGERQSCCR